MSSRRPTASTRSSRRLLSLRPRDATATRRRETVVEHDDAVTGLQHGLNSARRGTESIACRGNDGIAVGLTTEQARGQFPNALRIGEEVRRRPLPRMTVRLRGRDERGPRVLSSGELYAVLK